MAGDFQLNGTREVMGKLRRLADKAPDAIGGALYRRGEAIMTRSKDEFVPVDLGTLKSSGFTHPPQRRGREASVLLSYGNAAAPYALIQHEADFRHTVGSRKYLEIPFNEAVPSLAQDLAADLGVTLL